MLTGDIRNQVDGIWNDFWAGGIANPLSVIEQITYLLLSSGSTSCIPWKNARAAA